MARLKIFPALSFLYSLILIKDHTRGAEDSKGSAAVNCPPGQVTQISDDQQFYSTMKALGNKLVVVDYTAAWCGPCRSMCLMMPYSAKKFAEDYPNVTFLKVDIDVCKITAQEHKIESIPTFICYRGMGQLSIEVGANKQKLGAMIAKQVAHMAHGSNDPNSSSSSANNNQNLISFVAKHQNECLNCKDMNNEKFQLFLEQDDNVEIHVESDSHDPEILMKIVFTQPVKLYSLKIEAPSSNGPKSLVLFVNQPNSIDFNSAGDNSGVKRDQRVELKPANLEGESIRLLHNRFRLVHSLQILVQSNQSGAEGIATRINKFAIEGSPL